MDSFCSYAITLLALSMCQMRYHCRPKH